MTNQQQVRSCYQTFYILYRSFISSTNLSDERVKCVKSVLGLAWRGVMCSHLQLSSLQSLNPSFHQSQKWISAGIMITISYNWTSYSALSRYSLQLLGRQVIIITSSLHCGSITVWCERIYFAGLGVVQLGLTGWHLSGSGPDNQSQHQTHRHCHWRFCRGKMLAVWEEINKFFPLLPLISVRIR